MFVSRVSMSCIATIILAVCSLPVSALESGCQESWEPVMSINEDDTVLQQVYIRASSGESRAKNDLGLYYMRDGYFAPAYKWFLLAVNGGHTPSQTNLNDVASKLPRSDIVEQSRLALSWLACHARSGNIYAQYESAKFHLTDVGDSMHIDLVKGFGWLVVAEHNVRELYLCCEKLKSDISNELIKTAPLLTSMEHDEAMEFARAIISQER